MVGDCPGKVFRANFCFEISLGTFSRLVLIFQPLSGFRETSRTLIRDGMRRARSLSLWIVATTQPAPDCRAGTGARTRRQQSGESEYSRISRTTGHLPLHHGGATAAFIPMPTVIWSHKTAIRCNPPSPILTTQAGPVGCGPKAAREFEAQLIGSLLESMEKTLAALPGEDSSSESDNYSFLATHALSQAIAEPGAFGIAAMIAPHLTEAPLKAARK